MTKTIRFGNIDFTGNEKKDNFVTVEIEYKKNNNGQMVFSANGNIWNVRHTDILCGGQCLDTIKEYINTPLFNEVYRLWKLYHLNDMHPECEHQQALKWNEKAHKQVNLYTYALTSEARTQQRDLEQSFLNKIINGDSVKATEDEKAILKLDYFYKTHLKELPDNLKKFYKLYETKTAILGHTKENEHPEGLLCKPCPICGYQYGTAWTYRAIPQEDEKIILQIISGIWEG